MSDSTISKKETTKKCDECEAGSVTLDGITILECRIVGPRAGKPTPECLERQLASVQANAGEMMVCFADELDSWEELVDCLPSHLQDKFATLWDAGKAEIEKRRKERAARQVEP